MDSSTIEYDRAEGLLHYLEGCILHDYEKVYGGVPLPAMLKSCCWFVWMVGRQIRVQKLPLVPR